MKDTGTSSYTHTVSSDGFERTCTLIDISQRYERAGGGLSAGLSAKTFVRFTGKSTVSIEDAKAKVDADIRVLIRALEEMLVE